MTSTRPDRVGRVVRDLVRAGRWHRRLLAAGLAAGAAALAIDAVEPPPPPSAPVVVAARDVPGGTRLAARDVEVRRVDDGSVPTGAVTEVAAAVGRTVVSAVRGGEALTDVRLLGATGEPAVAVPVRIADAQSVGLLRPGDVVDVLAAGASGAAEPGTSTAARLVASAVRVVTVPRAPSSVASAAFGDGALVVVATTDSTAARLAGAAVTDRLSVVIRGQD